MPPVGWTTRPRRIPRMSRAGEADPDERLPHDDQRPRRSSMWHPAETACWSVRPTAQPPPDRPLPHSQAWRWPLTCQPVVLLLVGQCAAAVVDVVDEGVLLWVPAIATPAPPATSADARAPVTINRRTLAPPTDARGTSPVGRVSARAEYTMAGCSSNRPRCRSQIPMSPAVSLGYEPHDGGLR